jgi:gas vesicle protein
MGWLNLLFILLAAALPSVAAVSVAKEQTPTSITPSQLRGVIKASVERTQEALREEIKQTQEETEARISATLIEPLGKRIKSLEDKVNNAPPWLLTVVASAFLAALLNLISGQIKASLDQTKADNKNEFIRLNFPSFKASLQRSLKKQAEEIGEAEITVENVMKSPLVKLAYEEFTEAGFSEFNYIEAVRTLKVNILKQDFPKEGGRYIRNLATLFQQHQSQTLNLNRCLEAFSVLVLTLSVYTEQGLFKKYLLLFKYGTYSIRTLKESNAYQRDLETAWQAITKAVGELRQCNENLEKELEDVSILTS